MSSLIFVRDAAGRPLMPMAPAHARKLLAQGKARRQAHHAFTVVQLLTQIARPSVSPIVLGIQHEALQSRFWVMSYSGSSYLPLLYLQTELLARRPFCYFGDHVGKPFTSASQALSLRLASAVSTVISSLLPISSIHILALHSDPHLRYRLARVIRRSFDVPIVWLHQTKTKTPSPEARQLQAFMAQPSIALTACVALPTKLFLDQHRRLWSMSLQSRQQEYSIGTSESHLYLIDLRHSESFYPYWADDQRILWSQRVLRKDGIQSLTVNDTCSFIPIRDQGDPISTGEDSETNES